MKQDSSPDRNSERTLFSSTSNSQARESRLPSSSDEMASKKRKWNTGDIESSSPVSSLRREVIRAGHDAITRFSQELKILDNEAPKRAKLENELESERQKLRDLQARLSKVTNEANDKITNLNAIVEKAVKTEKELRQQVESVTERAEKAEMKASELQSAINKYASMETEISEARNLLNRAIYKVKKLPRENVSQPQD